MSKFLLQEKEKVNDLEQTQQPKALFIGVDQSYTGFGLVVLDETGLAIEKNLWKFPKKEGDGERLHIISDFLVWHFYRYKELCPNIQIAIEGYAYGAKLNREKLGELGGVVKAAIHIVFYKEPAIIAPTELKKFIAGSGKASKEDMLLAVQKLEPNITNHNVADAYGLARMLYSAN